MEIVWHFHGSSEMPVSHLAAAPGLAQISMIFVPKKLHLCTLETGRRGTCWTCSSAICTDSLELTPYQGWCSDSCGQVLMCACWVSIFATWPDLFLSIFSVCQSHGDREVQCLTWLQIFTVSRSLTVKASVNAVRRDDWVLTAESRFSKLWVPA